VQFSVTHFTKTLHLTPIQYPVYTLHIPPHLNFLPSTSPHLADLHPYSHHFSSHITFQHLFLEMLNFLHSSYWHHFSSLNTFLTFSLHVLDFPALQIPFTSHVTYSMYSTIRFYGKKFRVLPTQCVFILY
jgi:hypothetical protein